MRIIAVVLKHEGAVSAVVRDRVAEIDGAYFGGHVGGLRTWWPIGSTGGLPRDQSGKRQVVVVIRRARRPHAAAVRNSAEEACAVLAIRQRIKQGTVVPHADESPAWNKLHARFAMQRINHQDGYSIGGACTNAAGPISSRLRRGELRASPPYRRAVSPSLCPGGSLAGGPPPRQQRRAGAQCCPSWRCNAGHRLTSAATFSSAHCQRFARHTCHLTPPAVSVRSDRLFQPGSGEPENSPFDQCAPAVADRREAPSRP